MVLEKKNKKKKSKNRINHATGLSYHEFLCSSYWKEVRKKVLKRDKYECIVCHSNYKLCVHHTTYKHHGFEDKHLSDLVTLCDVCHKSTHGLCDEEFNNVLRRNI
jgi:5-methylcytosine-specific restriction endonuclease McrA